MTKKVSDIMVEVLEQAGVKHCYGIVGDTLNHFTDSISKSSISWVHVRHEEVGGFAAGADAMMSGQLTACAGSCGPGSLHFINGLFESHRNRSPVILIASQLATDQTGFYDFPQYVDFKSIYKNCSVFCEEITDASQARHVMASACKAAINQRALTPQTDTRPAERELEIRLGGSMERYIWTINGKKFNEAEPLKVKSVVILLM